MTAASRSFAADGDAAARLAERWFARLGKATPGSMPFEESLPAEPAATLAAFAAIALAHGRSLRVLVADDEALPELSNALGLAIRPLCLVLPAADFAASIALRATLSLLKSRLWRDGEESRSAAWNHQRQHLATCPELWQRAQSWSPADGEVPPEFAALFPVHILPLVARPMSGQHKVDITLLYRCDAPHEQVAATRCLLQVGLHAGSARETGLAAHEETPRLLHERAQLTQDIADLELELASVEAELDEFTRDYYARVGRLLAEQDALQARLAGRDAARQPANSEARSKAEARERQAEQSANESRRFNAADASEASVLPRGDAVKRLFRRIAQQIHPDRANDEVDRAWRTQLMIEANHAYRLGDEPSLRQLAARWQASREVTPGAAANPSPATTPQLQVERLRARLATIEAELHRLFGSRLYELFVATRHARRQGRDLLDEMARQLDASISDLRQEIAGG
jgi:hypothetical protein